MKGSWPITTHRASFLSSGVPTTFLWKFGMWNSDADLHTKFDSKNPPKVENILEKPHYASVTWPEMAFKHKHGHRTNSHRIQAKPPKCLVPFLELPRPKCLVPSLGLAPTIKSWFSGRGWGQQLSLFRVRRFTESPGPLHWIAFPVEILTKPLIHWIASPLFTENPFFHWKVFRRIPFPKIGFDSMRNLMRNLMRDLMRNLVRKMLSLFSWDFRHHFFTQANFTEAPCKFHSQAVLGLWRSFCREGPRLLPLPESYACGGPDVYPRDTRSGSWNKRQHLHVFSAGAKALHSMHAQERRCVHSSLDVGRREKTPTPKISALLRKRPVLLRANFVLAKDRKRPYYGHFCGQIHREGSCSKAAGGP